MYVIAMGPVLPAELPPKCGPTQTNQLVRSRRRSRRFGYGLHENPSPPARRRIIAR